MHVIIGNNHLSPVSSIEGPGPGKILELRRRTFERNVMFGDSCQVRIWAVKTGPLTGCLTS